MFRVVVFLVFLFAVTFAERDCGKTKNVEAKPNQILAKAGTKCLNSAYKLFNGYCYYVSRGEPGNGNWCESKCKFHADADLVSIHSYSENMFIYSLDIPKDGVWIGLQKDPVGFCWTWSDGSGNSFKNWVDNPQQTENISNWARMNAEGLWDYADKNAQLNYVCKQPAV